MTETTVILGLGSNVGDRRSFIGGAVDMLASFVSGMRFSRILESRAVLLPGSPPEWDLPFLNMALAGKTTLSAEALMAETQAIERLTGRCDHGRWGPREIDIDILAMDDLVMNSPSLTIPHPELLSRDFALIPLAEVEPDWRYPGEGPFKGMTVSEIIAKQGFHLGEHLRDTGIRFHA